MSVGDGGATTRATQAASQQRRLPRPARLAWQGAAHHPQRRHPSTTPTRDNSARCNVTGRTDAGKNCQETFASGLRNPFRLAFDPDASGTRFLISDVGSAGGRRSTRARRGATTAGTSARAATTTLRPPGVCGLRRRGRTPPIHEYSHGSGCSSITGGAFVPNGFWPDAYDNSYLFGDYVCDKIFELKPKGGGGFANRVRDRVSGGPVAMAFGPYGSGQALYYATYANGGEVRRITYLPKPGPTARLTPS